MLPSPKQRRSRQQKRSNREGTRYSEECYELIEARDRAAPDQNRGVANSIPAAFYGRGGVTFEDAQCRTRRLRRVWWHCHGDLEYFAPRARFWDRQGSEVSLKNTPLLRVKGSTFSIVPAYTARQCLVTCSNLPVLMGIIVVFMVLFVVLSIVLLVTGSRASVANFAQRP
jgi:hypothetical protein